MNVAEISMAIKKPHSQAGNGKRKEVTRVRDFPFSWTNFPLILDPGTIIFRMA
jgi:hypothetical protein